MRRTSLEGGIVITVQQYILLWPEQHLRYTDSNRNFVHVNFFNVLVRPPDGGMTVCVDCIWWLTIRRPVMKQISLILLVKGGRVTSCCYMHKVSKSNA